MRQANGNNQSNVAGTRRYMAPEWTSIVDSQRELLGEQPCEGLKNLDVYALGIILADLICNPQTQMESTA